jgi:hypothetical protein
MARWGVCGQRHASGALPQGKTRYPSYRRLSGPQGRSAPVRRNSPSPGFGSWTAQPVVSSYTDWAIPAPVWLYLLTPWSRVLLEKLMGFAANQEIPRILWNNPKVHYSTHKCPPDWKLNTGLGIRNVALYYASHLKKASMNFVMSLCPPVCPRGTIRLSLGGFSRNLILDYFFENMPRKFNFH